MDSQDAHRAAEQHYREVADLSQLNRDAERMAARRAAASMVDFSTSLTVVGEDPHRAYGMRDGAPYGVKFWQRTAGSA